MKKYITFLSLITMFFVGIQQNQAQEKKTLDETQGKEKKEHYNELANKEKQQNPEHKAKVAKLEMDEANSQAKQKVNEIKGAVSDLSSDQQNELHKRFLELKKGLNSKDAKLIIEEILSEEQMAIYNEHLTKVSKS